VSSPLQLPLQQPIPIVLDYKGGDRFLSLGTRCSHLPTFLAIYDSRADGHPAMANGWANTATYHRNKHDPYHLLWPNDNKGSIPTYKRRP